jgi:hypothetical protein
MAHLKIPPLLLGVSRTMESGCIGIPCNEIGWIIAEKPERIKRKSDRFHRHLNYISSVAEHIVSQLSSNSLVSSSRFAYFPKPKADLKKSARVNLVY